jgi:tetratricopeptide (TPR) repeat protein
MKLQLVVAALAMMLSGTSAYASPYCGELKTHYGPFDYRKRVELAQQLEMVEHAHFTPDVEKLIQGVSGYLGGDLHYTLETWPNHHRALASLARLALKTKSNKVSGLKFSFECYFNRAIRFRPDDGTVRMLYGSYLYKLGRANDALEQLEEAARLEPENGIINYNLGLVYFNRKDYDKALIFAKKAEALEYPLTALKSKLTQIGKWDETPRK